MKRVVIIGWFIDGAAQVGHAKRHSVVNRPKDKEGIAECDHITGNGNVLLINWDRRSLNTLGINAKQPMTRNILPMLPGHVEAVT